MARSTIAILVLSLAAGGCVVTQRQDTLVMQKHIKDSASGRNYWLYVPSNYDASRPWPLVITLHGGWLWDSASDQIREWKYLAETQGFIVAAPELESAQMCVILRGGWMKDLASDEKAILAIIDELSAKYTIPKEKTLLTAFLEGGYPLYYTGLRNPGSFAALVARDCYTDVKMLETIDLSGKDKPKDPKDLPIRLFWGKHGWGRLSTHGWRAFRFLRENKCFQTTYDEKGGGQLRRPKTAYEFWAPLVGN